MTNYNAEFRERLAGQHDDDEPKPRRKRKTEIIEIGHEATPPAPVIDDGDDLQNWQSWSNFADGVAEIEISVYRAPNAHRGKEAFCMKCSSMTYTPEQLAEHVQYEFGGGDYRVRGYANGRLVFNRPLTVEGRTANLPAPVAAHTPDLATFQTTMMEMQLHGMRAQMEMMTNLVQSIRPQQQPSQMEMMQGMFSMMATVRDMFKAPEVTITNPMDQFKMFLDFGKELGIVGGGPSEREPGANDVMLALLQNAGPLLQKMAEAQAQRPAQIMPNPIPANSVPQIAPQLRQNPAPIAPNQNAALQQKIDATPSPLDKIPKQVRALDKVLLQGLMSGSVSGAAQLLIDATNPLNDDDFDAVTDFIYEADAVAKLCAAAPQLIAQRQFLSDVFDLLREAWSADDGPDETPFESDGPNDDLLTGAPESAINQPEPAPELGENDATDVLPVAT